MFCTRFPNALPFSHSPLKWLTSITSILATRSFSIAMLILAKAEHCHETVTLQLYLGKYKPDVSISTHKCNNIISQGSLPETTQCLCAQPLKQLRPLMSMSWKKLKLHCKVRLCCDQRKNRKQKSSCQDWYSSVFSNLASGISHRVSTKLFRSLFSN